ncbi:MAG: hypothetical protein MI924_33965 [Chloroflexales bacterium]|nr:hypothetical protein [Chloroflexales bacterium]
MKTIDLTTVAQQVEELLALADTEDLLIRLPSGKIFLLASVIGEDDSDEDFADEITRTRHNAALMALLYERSYEQKRLSSEETRKRLGIV